MYRYIYIFHLTLNLLFFCHTMDPLALKSIFVTPSSSTSLFLRFWRYDSGLSQTVEILLFIRLLVASACEFLYHHYIVAEAISMTIWTIERLLAVTFEQFFQISAFKHYVAFSIGVESLNWIQTWLNTFSDI